MGKAPLLIFKIQGRSFFCKPFCFASFYAKNKNNKEGKDIPLIAC